VPSGAGGVCENSQFNVSATGKVCQLVQCSQPVDCCPTPPPNCAALQAQCGDAGPSSFYCQQYDQNCKCDGSKFNCNSGQCVPRCNADIDCNYPNNKCANGTCAQCAQDSDCTTGDTCNGGTCMPPCKSDGDCPGFMRCNNSQCTPSGCKTDRECVSLTRHVDATCGTDGSCIIPCQTDTECGNPQEYDFYSCIKGTCASVGCDTVKDCELRYLNGNADAGLPPKEHVVCQ
jgi:hypothetical protein